MESQIESAESARRTPSRKPRTPAELQLVREKETLLLSRTRVLRDLENSQHDRYKQILHKALGNLDARIAKLDDTLSRSKNR